MPNQRMNRMFQGAMLLSVASLIAKILSAVYRVPFQNLVGNTGFYVYQQIYPIYGIGMTFALSGLPVFISKLAAETPDDQQAKALMRQTAVLLAGISILIMVGLNGFASPIAHAMGDHGLVPLIRAVSWMFLLMPGLAVTRGYYQGRFQMGPTARSQVIEQLIRISIILLVAYYATQLMWSPYKMGAWAMASAPIAAVAALASMSVAFWRLDWRQSVSMSNWWPLLKRLLIEGGTICLFAAIMVLFQLVDSFTVKRGLVAGGILPDAAKNLKGIYDRAQPLVQLGLVMATGLSTSLLPSLTIAIHNRQTIEFNRVATIIIRLALLISMAATVGMMILMPQINLVLFGSTAGSNVIAVYVISILLAAMISTYTNVLQSADQYRLPVVALIAGLLVKSLLTFNAVKTFGTIGASWVTNLGLAVVLAVLMVGTHTQFNLPILRERFTPKISLALVFMIIGVGLADHGLMSLLSDTAQTSRLWNFVIVILCAAVGGVIFIGITLLFRTLSVRELYLIPMGRRLLKRTRGK